MRRILESTVFAFRVQRTELGLKFGILSLGFGVPGIDVGDLNGLRT